jgi:hypothetical protein
MLRNSLVLWHMCICHILWQHPTCYADADDHISRVVLTCRFNKLVVIMPHLLCCW